MNKTCLLPFSPARWPFFYGFIVVVFGSLGIVMSIPGQTIGVSVFTDYLIEAMAISRVNMSLAYLFGTVTSAMLLSQAGKLYDRCGARVVTSAAALGLGAMLIFLQTADNFAQRLAGFIPFLPYSFVAFVTIIFGFFGIRFFGQGIMTMSSRNMVMKWFKSKRGLVNVVLGLSMSFGFSSSPRLLEHLIRLLGWRGAWQVMGLVVGLGFLLMVLVFFRDNPQDCGLEPDGPLAKIRTKSPKPATDQPPEEADEDYTLREARRTYTFWLICLSLTLASLVITALTFHVVSIFQTAGIGRETAVKIFLPSAVVAGALQVTGSTLSDYIKLKWFLHIQLLGLLLVTGTLGFLHRGAPVWAIIAGYGMISGMFGIISTISWPNYYGVKHLGAISGYVMAFQVAGSAAGPYLFSLSFKVGGRYSAAAFLSFAAAFSLFLGSFWVKKPFRIKNTLAESEVVSLHFSRTTNSSN